MHVLRKCWDCVRSKANTKVTNKSHPPGSSFKLLPRAILCHFVPRKQIFIIILKFCKHTPGLTSTSLKFNESVSIIKFCIFYVGVHFVFGYRNIIYFLLHDLCCLLQFIVPMETNETRSFFFSFFLFFFLFLSN